MSRSAMPELHLASGVRLAYDVVGEGDPLLLIPGTGQGATLWALQVPCYSERYRCIVLDNRGAGRSDVPEDGYSMLQMADDAAAVLRSLGIDRAHVVGPIDGQRRRAGARAERAWPGRITAAAFDLGPAVSAPGAPAPPAPGVGPPRAMGPVRHELGAGAVHTRVRQSASRPVDRARGAALCQSASGTRPGRPL